MNQLAKSLSACQNVLWKSSLLTLATASLWTGAVNIPAIAAMEDSPKAVVDEIWQIVNNEFVEKNFNQVDWIKIRQELLQKDYANKSEAYKAIREALKQLGDPYTRFLPPEEFEDLTSQTSGELSGIGIRLEIDKQTSQLTVVEPMANSPAMKAGIKSGDKILKINGKSTSLMSLEQASEEIKGKVGTKITLEISRQGKGLFGLTLTRANIELPSVSYQVKQEDGLRIGYIKLDEFSSHAAEQMKQAIEKLQKQQISAFVLDLRGNPGGLLFSSVDIARMWMKKGAIVSTIDRKGGDRKFFADGTALTDLPLAILVDENSASASEILTGALKDNGRAVVVGTKTFGKGTVQSVHSLTDGSGLAVTIARYYTPKGVNITKKGIMPDITQDLTVEQQVKLNGNPGLIGTPADPQYQKAISILKTTALIPNRQILRSAGMQ